MQRTHTCTGGGQSPRWESSKGDGRDGFAASGRDSTPSRQGRDRPGGQLQFEFGEFVKHGKAEAEVGKGGGNEEEEEASFVVKEGEEELVLGTW